MLLPRVTRLPVCWGHKTLWHDQLTLGHQNRSRESSVALSWLLYASAQNRILFLWPQPLTWSSHKAPITARRCQEQRAFWGCTITIFFCIRTGHISWGARQREEEIESLKWGYTWEMKEKWMFQFIAQVSGESRYLAPLLHGHMGPGWAFWVDPWPLTW